VTTQGYAVTSGRRERSSPSLSTLCGHLRHCSATPGTVTTSSTLLECTGTGRHHDRHCAAYGPPVDGTLEPAHGSGQTTNHYAATLETPPVRAQNVPRRPNWSRIRQDGRQLLGTARHASTHWKIVRHACKLLPPWPIKGGAVPQPQGTTDSDHPHALRLHYDIGTCLNQYLLDLEARPPLLPRLYPPLRAPRCEAI
jgi:hypothetical protein